MITEHFLSLVLPAHNEELVAQYGKGTPNDLIERRLYQPLSLIGPVVTLVSNAWLFGSWGLAMWLFEMAWIPFFAAGVINGMTGRMVLPVGSPLHLGRRSPMVRGQHA